MKAKWIMNVINGLIDEDAVLLVSWDNGQKYPRVWLKEWCGPYKLSVSIATAEAVLKEIRRGLIHKPPKPPLRVPERLLIETQFVDTAL